MNRSEDALKVTVLTMAVLFLAVIIIMIFCIRGAAAHFHDHSELNAWVSSLQNRNGVLCCDIKDGTELEEPDWNRVYDKPDVHYHVRLDGQWVDVPDVKLVDGPNLADHALVWKTYTDGRPIVRCFMPGSMT